MMTEYYKFGHDIFGPFLYGFTRWLRTSLQKGKVEKIFFFSRDGYMMQKAYEAMEKENPLHIAHEYVFFSRNSLRRALLWTCKSYTESLAYMSKQRFVAFSEIASYYGLSKEESSAFLKKIGMRWDDVLLFDKLNENGKVKEVYDNFHSRIYDISRSQYNDIIDYLHQIRMNGHCAIVDIGWHGTMQYYLEQLLQQSKMAVDIVGLYIGINPIVPLIGRAYGYLFNEDNQKLRKPLLCFFGGGTKSYFKAMKVLRITIPVTANH